MSPASSPEGRPRPLRTRSLVDWVRLAGWIAFRPGKLKRYLYRHAPDLYRTGPGWGALRRVALSPAYATAIEMTPLLAGALSLTLSLVIAAVAGLWLKTPLNLLGLGWGALFGLIHGALLCGAFLLLSATVLDVAVGVTMGITLGVVGGAAVGVASAVAYALPPGQASLVVEAAAFGLAFGLVLPAVGGAASDLAASAALSVSLAAGILLLDAVLRRVGLPVLVGVPAARDIAVPAAVFVATSLRVPLYLGELLLALTQRWHRLPHAIIWDELLMAPLPGSVKTLCDALGKDMPSGLALVGHVAQNPFQRWAADAALHRHLHASAQPLRFLYGLLAVPDLGEPAGLPLGRREWRESPTLRQVLLAGLGQRWLEPETRLGWVEEMVWGALAPLRTRRSTPLTLFAGLLCDLAYDERAVGDLLSARREDYVDLEAYPGGSEIARSFACLATWLSYDQLDELGQAAAAYGPALSGALEGAIRPAVLRVMEDLARVGQDVRDHLEADSGVERLTALAHASEALEGLETLVQHTVTTPEKALLSTILARWTRLVDDAGGKQARDTLRRALANPYTVGAPATGERFIGRGQVLQRFDELWGGQPPRPSVAVYGQPFIGKSSLLLQLGERFGTRLRIVDFNLQRLGLVQDTIDLLTNLALALYDSLDPTARESVDRPKREYLAMQNPYMAFDRFLRALAPLRGERDLVIALDEYEVLDNLAATGRLDPHVFDFMRGLIQTYPWLVLVLAGRHHLRSLERPYWRPLAGAVLGVRLGPMTAEEARRLLREPVSGFAVAYDVDALDLLVDATGRQPFLLQLVGHHLFSRFNRDALAPSLAKRQRFTVADVEATLADPVLAVDGSVYLRALMGDELAHQEPPLVFGALAGHERGSTTDELADAWGVSRDQAERVLLTWQQWEVVARGEDGAWHLTLELVRRWSA